MSRLDPEEQRPQNPAKRFFEYSGKDCELTYYDKNQERPDKEKIEKEIADLEASLATTPEVAKKAVQIIIGDLKKKKDSHDIPVKLPFTFIALDRMITIGGYNQPEKIGYYANEIKQKDLSTGVFQLRSKKGLEAEGTWEYIKGVNTFVKYTEVVYIAYLEGAEMCLGAIKMTGSSLTSWFNYVNGEFKDKKRISDPHDPYKGAITLSVGGELINGETRYFPPAFAQKELKPETEAKALELAKELKAYHQIYFAYQAKQNAEAEVVKEEVKTDPGATFEPGIGDGRTAKEVVMDKAKEKADDFDLAPDDLPF